MEALQSNFLPSTNRQNVKCVTATSPPSPPLASCSPRTADALAPEEELLLLTAVGVNKPAF